MYRDPSFWGTLEPWIEQCWRDVLMIISELDPDSEKDKVEFAKLYPSNRPLLTTFIPSQQFLLSRDQVHKRPLEVWKKLYKVIVEQPVCHQGDPDYHYLYAKNDLLGSDLLFNTFLKYFLIIIYHHFYRPRNAGYRL